MANSWRVSDVKVTMDSNYEIATKVFRPEGVASTKAWNRTQKVAAVGRRNASYKRGELVRSIRAQKSSIWRPDRPVYEVRATANHAAPQEYGFVHWRSGRFIPGKHYLREANRTVRW